MEDLNHLIKRARKGELDAYERLVQRLQPMALRYADAVLGDFQAAEDAVQEAFVEAYAQLSNLRHPAALAAWLRRIVFKHCDRLTRKKRLPTAPLAAADAVADPGPTPAEHLERRRLQQRVASVLGELSPFERRLLRLFYFDGYSQKEISALLDLPPTAVKSRLHATRQLLRQRIKPAMEDTNKLTDADFARRLAEDGLSHYAIDRGKLRFKWGKMRVEVSAGQGEPSYTLRFHYPAYMDLPEAWYSKEAISSELLWLEALARDLGLDGQVPVANLRGDLLTQLAGDGLRWPLYCTLLRRVRGDYPDDTFPTGAQTTSLGNVLARIHEHGKTWRPPPGFCRPQWDWPFLNSFLNRLQPALSEGLLSEGSCERLAATMERLQQLMAQLGKSGHHWGLIHGALHDDQYYVDGDRALPVDFAACGYGHFYKDLGHCLNHLPPEKRRLLIAGYQQVRPLPADHMTAITAFALAARLEANAHHFLNPDEPPGWEAGLAELADTHCQAFLAGNLDLLA